MSHLSDELYLVQCASDNAAVITSRPVQQTTQHKFSLPLKEAKTVAPFEKDIHNSFCTSCWKPRSIQDDCEKYITVDSKNTSIMEFSRQVTNFGLLLSGNMSSSKIAHQTHSIM